MNESGLKTKQSIQQEALEAIQGQHRASVGISMGVGKTLIGLQHMEQEYKNGFRKFLVVVPKNSIIDSWKTDAVKFNLEHLLEHIDFTTYLSLHKKSRDYDAIYLDECHSLLYSHDYYLSTYTGKILGLTGTPPRFAKSEKGEMVKKYCPVVFRYGTDNAVEDNILNDYEIEVHMLELGSARNFKIETKKGGQFMSSEKAAYDFWTEKIQNATSPSQLQIMRIMRMQSLMKFPTKEKYAKKLLDLQEDKCIVFCNTTEQADRICSHSYHSKNPDSELNLDLFKGGNIKKLSSVAQLNEGVNIPNLKQGIIMHAYSNERKSSQRLGRLLRLSPDQKSKVIVLMYKDTVDQEWVREALKDLDPFKITYTEPL